MAVYEKCGLMQRKNANGTTYILYPITRLDCVDGAETLLPMPETASVGQIIRVTAVDENGMITATEAVTMESSSLPTLDEDGVLIFG